MKQSLILFAEKYRTFLTRVFAVFLIPVLLFSKGDFLPSWSTAFDMTGLFLLAVCAFGRLWASVYISGHKIESLIDIGPYSIVRHPLYVFSFLGLLGLGFISKSLIVFASLIVFFVVYYPLVMLSEEQVLINKHGEEYLSYMKRVPRFFPDFSLLKEPVTYNVHTVILRKAMFDAIWFIWGIIPLKIIEALHRAGILPSYF